MGGEQHNVKESDFFGLFWITLNCCHVSEMSNLRSRENIEQPCACLSFNVIAYIQNCVVLKVIHK